MSKRVFLACAALLIAFATTSCDDASTKTGGPRRIDTMQNMVDQGILTGK